MSELNQIALKIQTWSTKIVVNVCDIKFLFGVTCNHGAPDPALARPGPGPRARPGILSRRMGTGKMTSVTKYFCQKKI